MIPHQFLAGYYPGDKLSVKADQKLSALLDSSLRAFINLMEPDEMDCGGEPFIGYEERLHELADHRSLSIACYRFPIRDISIPDPALMRQALDQVDRSMAEGEPVYVHCWGGVGRTGTLVGCWLARHGIAVGEAAIQKISDLRQNSGHAYRPSPETSAQCAFVMAWKEGD